MRAYSTIFASLIVLAAHGCATGNSTGNSTDDEETGGTSNNTGGNSAKGGSVGIGGTTNPGSGGTSPAACTGVMIDDFTLAGPQQFWSFSAVTPETLEIKKREDGDRNGKAIHMKGTVPDKATWGASAVFLPQQGLAKSNDCVMSGSKSAADVLGASKGIKFWAKGAGTLTVGAAVGAVLPPANGGTCQEESSGGCFNPHQRAMGLSGNWTEYVVKWDELEQRKDVKPQVNFDPKQVVQLSFSFLSGAFELWLDDVTFLTDGSTTGPFVCQLDKHMNEGKFNSLFPNKNGFYTYGNLCKALEKFTGFANSGNAEQDKREIAAFFAHVEQETGGLVHIKEIGCATAAPWCGRGPLQLTHKANYEFVADYLGKPEIVSSTGSVLETDGVLTWQAALWFWNIYQESTRGTCNGAMAANDFGRTIAIINGKLECPSTQGGENGDKARKRIANFQNFAGQLGTNTNGVELNCGPI